MRLKISSLLVAVGVASGLGGVAAKAAAPATPQGYINFRTYGGDVRGAVLAGTAVPDGSFYPKRMEGPYNGYPDPDPGDDDTKPGSDLRNNYTTELVGYWYPPKDGKVQFAIATDDPGTFYFSTDDDPAHKQPIATESQWNPVRAFGGAWDGTTATRRSVISCGDAPVPRPENWSSFIQVTKGKPYFIQSISAEFGGGDNNAIAVRYDTDAEFADDDHPIPGSQLSPFYGVGNNATVLSQPADAAVYAGSAATFSVGVDVGPTGSITSTKWQKNGVDIPDSNALSVSVPTTAGDDGAKIKAIVTTSLGTVTSSEATLTVATLSNEFTPGIAKWDVYKDISGGSVDSLTSDPKYPDNPDETRILTSFESPVNVYENFGARLSGFFIPPANGNYVFFMTSDDNGALYLSTDDNPANKKQIAAETAWSNAREWTTSGGSSDLDSKRSDKFPGTEWPGGNTINLKGGTRYYLEVLAKEGGGGDNDGATVIKEGDPDPASGTASTLTGSWIGANAKPSKGDPQITAQPTFPAQLQQGRSYEFSVSGVVAPAAFNYPLVVQWQKNGADIPGATGKTYKIASAAASDAGTYRAVLSTTSGKSVTTAESANLAVLPDTFPPVPTAGALLKGGKQEIGVGFDEEVKLDSAKNIANYSLSAGTIDSVRVANRPATGFSASLGIKEYNGIVLVASGLTAGQTYQLTVKNVEDLAGNKIPAAGVTVPFKAEGSKTWSVVGANEAGFANDVVRTGDGSFDVISGGVAFWADYDEATFVNDKVKGDFDAKVQLVDQDPSSQWARTGLMAREALDEGKQRPDHGNCDMAIVDCNFCVPKETLFSRLQTVHANAAIRADKDEAADGGVSNDAFENHFRDESTYSAAWANQMNSADGGFGPLNDPGNPQHYPDAVWMRLQRQGNTLKTYRSSDGQNWIGMTTRAFKNLADEIYVGPFYGPELSNNGNADGGYPNGIRDKLGHGVLAKFRNYSLTTGGVQPPPGDLKFTAFTFTGGKLHIEWTGTNAKLQRADSITGPWTDVTGATSPRDIDPTGAAGFYRLTGQ